MTVRMNHTRTRATPCLWQAPASAQKSREVTRGRYRRKAFRVWTQPENRPQTPTWGDGRIGVFFKRPCVVSPARALDGCMNLAANPPALCRIGKRPPAPENRPATGESRGTSSTARLLVGRPVFRCLWALATPARRGRVCDQIHSFTEEPRGGAPSTVRPLARDLRVLIGWPFPLGFGLDGRLLLARRGRVYV